VAHDDQFHGHQKYAGFQQHVMRKPLDEQGGQEQYKGENYHHQRPRINVFQERFEHSCILSGRGAF
jgi:hypothetical protein